eukprot:scaffold25496_cov21-Tisochrysis_lutea.AAC.1
MLDEEGAVLEGGEGGANGGVADEGNSHEQQQAEAARPSPQLGGRAVHFTMLGQAILYTHTTYVPPHVEPFH